MSNPEVNIKMYLDAIKEFTRPVPLNLIHREINRKKGQDNTKLKECAEALFIMALEGWVLVDDNMLYSIPASHDLI